MDGQSVAKRSLPTSFVSASMTKMHEQGVCTTLNRSEIRRISEQAGMYRRRAPSYVTPVGWVV